MARLLLLAVTAALVASCVAQVPIPSRPDGVPYLNAETTAPLQIDVFVDPMCPDCKAAYPTIQQVAAHYGPKVVRFNFHLFPLPYHRNAFYASQGAKTAAQQDGDLFFKWLEAVFAAQDSLGNAATANMTADAVIDMFGDVGQSIGISKATIVAGINNANVDSAVRTSWKYACTRGVAGTPWFFFNGVNVAVSPQWTVDDWQNVINSIITPQSLVQHNFGRALTCPSGQKECVYLPGKTECCLTGENCIPNVGCRC
eukprot:Opistho-1_new@109173